MSVGTEALSEGNVHSTGAQIQGQHLRAKCNGKTQSEQNGSDWLKCKGSSREGRCHRQFISQSNEPKQWQVKVGGDIATGKPANPNEKAPNVAKLHSNWDVMPLIFSPASLG